MSSTRFSLYAWTVLGYNLLVVLWGAFVRATGSGAGCGSHWPLCNGVVIPRPERVETLIELGHRLTSGLALVAVVGMLVWAIRIYPRGHHVRRAAWVSTVFLVVEALLGAGLVLFELVAENDSMLRAFSMIAHLVNTFLLVAALTVTAWWASGGERFRARGQGTAGALLGVGMLGVLVVGATGAIAALGDTLFPARTFAEGFRAELSTTAHLLLRLRVLHPVVAIGVGIYLLVAARLLARLRPSGTTARLAALLSVGVLVQLAVGAANVALLAPIWMQLVHLLLADLVWIALVLLGAAALAAPARVEVPATAHRPLAGRAVHDP